MSTSNSVKQQSNGYANITQGLLFLLLGALCIVGLGTKIAMMSAPGIEFSASGTGQMLINLLASTKGTIGDLFMLVGLLSLAYFTTSAGIFKFTRAGSKRRNLAFQQSDPPEMEDLSKVLLSTVKEVSLESNVPAA